MNSSNILSKIYWRIHKFWLILNLMDVSLLEQAGLNTTQGKAYIALITSGSLTPPSLAAKIGIARTNAYEVLKQLEELELVSKTGSGTKMSYRPANPAALERLMERRRNEVL